MTATAEKEKDIYEFDFEDPPSPPPKTTAMKRRRAATEEHGAGAAKKKGGKDDDSDFEEPTTTKQKAKKTPAARSKTMPEVFELSSGDDYEPNPRAKAPTKGKKATRSNTDQQELLPPMPKPKRQKRDLTKELADFLPLPAEKEATSRSVSPQKAFMVDMTHDIPMEKRHEYVLHSDAALASTIPDPPEFLETVDPRTGLSMNQEQVSPPADSSGFAPPPLDSSGDVSLKDAAPSKRPSSPPPQPKTKKQRAKTDTALIGEFDSDASRGGIRIASEWRAAKAKGMQNLSGKQGQEQQASGFVEGEEIHSDGGGRKTTAKKKAPQPRKKKEPAAPKKKGKQAKNDEVIVLEETVNDTIAVADSSKPADDMVDELLGPTPVPTVVKPKADSQKTTQEVHTTPLHPAPAGDIEHPQLGLTEPATSFLDKIGRMSRAAADIEPKSVEADVEKPEAPKPAPAKRKRTKTAVEEPVDDYVEPEHSADEAVEVTAGKKKKPAAKTTAAKRKRTKTAEEKEPEPPTKKAAALRKKVARAKPKEAAVELEPEEGPKEELMKGPNEEQKEEPKEELEEGPKTPAPLPPPRSKSPEKAKESSKRGGTPHSPLRGGKIPYRVGLSKRARIEPLLSVRPREKKRPE
jgi:hypothetical protein